MKLKHRDTSCPYCLEDISPIVMYPGDTIRMGGGYVLHSGSHQVRCPVCFKADEMNKDDVKSYEVDVAETCKRLGW